MSILLKYLPFVNEQIAHQDKMIIKYATGKLASTFRTDLHTETKNKLIELSADLIKADNELDIAAANKEISNQSPKQLILALSLDDIDGLPDELIKELSFSDADKSEYTILSIIQEAGGILSLDKILIGIYKKTNEIIKRTTLTSKLYRMSQKGMIFNVPIKKGIYSTTEINEEEAKKLIN